METGTWKCHSHLYNEVIIGYGYYKFTWLVFTLRMQPEPHIIRYTTREASRS